MNSKYKQLSDVHHKEFMECLTRHMARITDEKPSESEVLLDIQDANEKFLTYLITMVHEGNVTEYDMPDELIDAIVHGRLTYENAGEYALTTPMYELDFSSLKDLLRPN